MDAWLPQKLRTNVIGIVALVCIGLLWLLTLSVKYMMSATSLGAREIGLLVVVHLFVTL